MLVRLENALNCPDLAKQMMLVPKASDAVVSKMINLVVAYNGSARSQTALDLTLWIAHQTRLVTRQAVTVQVVYVVDTVSDRPSESDCFSDLYLSPVEVSPDSSGKVLFDVCERRESLETVCTGTVTRPSNIGLSNTTELALPVLKAVADHSPANQLLQFEKADRILWQARHLADEWRGSLETHLRFGNLIEELRAVACQVSTTALVVGCSSPSDPIVQALGQDLSFPILGIPATITSP